LYGAFRFENVSVGNTFRLAATNDLRESLKNPHGRFTGVFEAPIAQSVLDYAIEK
jgi:hypothetical protein